jgi:hypothetical protein
MLVAHDAPTLVAGSENRRAAAAGSTHRRARRQAAGARRRSADVVRGTGWFRTATHVPNWRRERLSPPLRPRLRPALTPSHSHNPP